MVLDYGGLGGGEMGEWVVGSEPVGRSLLERSLVIGGCMAAWDDGILECWVWKIGNLKSTATESPMINNRTSGLSQ